MTQAHARAAFAVYLLISSACGSPLIGFSQDSGSDCAATETKCNGRCVDTRTSTAHCGGCGNACNAGSSCTDGTCDTPLAATCTDGKQNGTETDIDCGGSCPACAAGKSCTVNNDCSDAICAGNKKCASANCDDAVKNGLETDVDCGADCTGCATGKTCGVNDDCADGFCGSTKRCVAPSCSDALVNGGESDLDCGQVCPALCAPGLKCNDDADCTTAHCTDTGVCATASCSDQRKNGTETDIDCGGSCTARCANGDSCALNTDCASGSCIGNLCTQVSCDNRCGNDCPLCQSGDACDGGTSCVTGVCTTTCQDPTCTDTVRNGAETDVDCGGADCSSCDAGSTCLKDTDCSSMLCSNGTCQPTNCQPGQTQVCGSSVGICTQGLRTCVGGNWSDCDGGVRPAATDICDGLDNDCDGNEDPGCSTCTSGSWYVEPVYAGSNAGQFPALAINENGTMAAAFYDVTSSRLRIAEHNGHGYWRRSTLDAITSTDVGSFASSVIDSTRGLHIAYYDAVNGDLRYMHRPYGASLVLTRVDATDDVGRFASIAVDSAGGAHISYYNATKKDLRYAYRPAGGAFVTPVTVDASGDVGSFSALSVDPAGGVHIAYYEAVSGNLKYAYKAPAGSFVVSPLVTTNDVGTHAAIATDATSVYITYADATAKDLKLITKTFTGSPSTPINVAPVADDTGAFSAIKVDASGVHVSYYDATVSGLRYAFKATNASSFTVTLVDSAFAVGTYNSLYLAPEGVYISYYDSTNADLRLAFRPIGASSFISSTVDTGITADVGRFGTLSMDSGGDLYIAYRNETKKSLQLAIRTPGDLWRNSVVDSTVGSGQFPSIVFDHDGGIHISHYSSDATAQDLLYAYRAPGTSSWQKAPVDTTGSVGTFSSIAVDSSNTPHIVSYRLDTADLRWSKKASGVWSSTNIETSNSVGKYASLKIASDNTMHVAFYDATNADLRYGTKAPASSSFVRSTTLDTASNVGEFARIALAPNGSPRILYYRATGAGSLRVAYLSGTTWASSAVADPVWNQSAPDYDVGPDGTDHVSYVEETTVGTSKRYTVKYARRSGGGSWQVTTVATAGVGLGSQTAIRVAPNGGVHIVYYATNPGDVMHAFRCP